MVVSVNDWTIYRSLVGSHIISVLNSERGFVLQSVRFRDRSISYSAVARIDSTSERGHLLTSVFQSEIGQQFDIARRNIRQGLGGGSRIGRRHVGYAIVNDAFLDINRLKMRGR